MNFVYSTLTCSNSYAFYSDKSADLPVVERQIEIKGGCGIAHKSLFTPKGILTKVTDEELSLLESNTHFQNHVKNGFIKVEKKETDIDKAIKSMEKEDKSAPLTPDSEVFKKDGAPKPADLNKNKRSN